MRMPSATATLLLALPLAGCACGEGDWAAIVVADAEASAGLAACEIGSLASVSRTSAALAKSADPALLDKARLEAEEECYKARATASGAGSDAAGSPETKLK